MKIYCGMHSSYNISICKCFYHRCANSRSSNIGLTRIAAPFIELSVEVFGITIMTGNRDQLMPDANFLTQKMPDERFSRICKLDFVVVQYSKHISLFIKQQCNNESNLSIWSFASTTV